jgi:hypothetical protein
MNSKEVATVTHDAKIIALVGGLVVFFYLVVTYILRSANNDRISKISKVFFKTYL